MNREEDIFEQALGIKETEAREEYLRSACEGDLALLERLQRLLGAHDRAGKFLEASQTAGGTSEILPLTAGRTSLLPAPEKLGDRIGHYKLLQQIGEGGCGVVYMAEQGEPIRRRVALKVIKLGMDTRRVIARFEAERQALALMDHPNIAKVFDAGATEKGRPYFVMELVRGVKITEYCDEKKLTTRQRLELFIQVCQAVQHAHQKGIIHRDLKPSNILVTEQDGRPVSKVIDFGIAKATAGQPLTDKTLFTAFEQFIGTPAYMSPEQTGLGKLDIDTRSDIYSLGVLLYELLTGQPPFGSAELRHSAIDEVLRTIRETEPPRPSNRLTALSKQELTVAAQQRQVEPVKLSHILRGDLDWIVMKCLEKERARRYETANGLARDVERHLNNEPVVACPPSRLYQLRKAARRNTLAFAAASAIVFVLIAGVLTTTWQAVNATRARTEAVKQKETADRERATADRITESLQQMLATANPETAKGRDYTVRQMLDNFAGNLGNKMTNEPEAEASLEFTIGNAYTGLAERDKGLQHLGRSLELRARLFGTNSQVFADTLVRYAWALQMPPGRGDDPEAEADFLQALEIYRQLGVSGKSVITALRLQMQYYNNPPPRSADVEKVANQALAEARKTPGIEYPEIAIVYRGLAWVKIAESNYTEAAVLASNSLAMQTRLLGPDSPELGFTWLALSQARQKGSPDYVGALEADQRALTLWQRSLPPNHPRLAYVLFDINKILQNATASARLSSLFPTPGKLDQLATPVWEIYSAPRTGTNYFKDTTYNADTILHSLPGICAKIQQEMAAAGRTNDAEAWRKESTLCENRIRPDLPQNPDAKP